MVFNRWTARGEADGLASLLHLYNQFFPAVRVINETVPTRLAGDYKRAVKSRMLGGDPPDTFQVAAGAALLDSWARLRYLEPLTNLWRVEGWQQAFPPALIDLLSLGGEVYAVPAGIQRGNLLWYNRRVFAEHGLPPPATYDELFATARQLRAAGVVPLAQASRERWEVPHLFETVLLGVAGEDAYRDLFAGRLPWTDERVQAALALLGRLLDCANPDRAALTWDQAAALVWRGEAAMTITGDWLKGYLMAYHWVPGEHFDVAPAPQTAGRFLLIAEAFGLPRGVEGRAVTIAFLKLLGSVDGQNALNPQMGSLPARQDAPLDGYDALARCAAADFQRDALVLSSAHGLASPEPFVESVEHALASFAEQRDVEATARRLDRAAAGLGLPS